MKVGFDSHGENVISAVCHLLASALAWRYGWVNSPVVGCAVVVGSGVFPSSPSTVNGECLCCDGDGDTAMLSVDRSAGDGEPEEDRDDGRGLDVSVFLVRELSPPINESTLNVENGFLVGNTDFTFNAGLTDGLTLRDTSWSLIPVSESELVRFVSVSPPQVGLLNADVRPVCCNTPAAIAARGTASTTPDIELAANNENTPTHNRPVSGLSHSPVSRYFTHARSRWQPLKDCRPRLKISTLARRR